MKFSELTSPSVHSDVEIARFEGVLKERDGYLVVETPENPGFYWGNYLIFPRPPTVADETLWPGLFQKEFAHQPRVRHMAFGWNETKPGHTFAGFVQEDSPIYSLDRARLKKPPRHRSDVVVRPLLTDQDWLESVEKNIRARPEGFAESTYRPFLVKQRARYRRMQEAGLGHWYGAYVKGELTADCGLYLFGNMGRFQAVTTYNEFRRQGISATMIYEIALAALNQVDQLLIVADPSSGADRVYASAGFSGQEVQWAQARRAPQDSAQ